MNNQKQIAPYLTLLITAAITASFSSEAEASHPYHVSKSEVSWNSKTGNFEVAMCVWPADLEKALAGQTGKPVDLDKVEKLDELLATYISHKFRVRKAVAGSQPAEVASVRWVGHERNHKEAWLYFEVHGGKTQSEWTLENRVFFELNPDQLNQIQFNVGRKINSFISSVNAPIHAINCKLPGNRKSKKTGTKID